MTEFQPSKSARASGARAALGRLFVLDLSGNRVLSLNPDGSDRKVIATECRLPDGIAVDVEGGHIYWTNMGVLTRTTAPSSAPTSTVGIAPRSFPKAARSRRNSSNSKRKAASCTGATGRGCASCALTSTGRRWKLSWRRARATLDRGRDADEVVRRHRRRCRARTHLLDAKRPGQCGARAHLPRRHRNSQRAERVQSIGH